MVQTIFFQQIRGIAILAFPVAVLAYFNPFFLHTVMGNCMCGLALGLYIFFKQYQLAKAQASGFTYAPSGSSKQAYEDAIRACAIDPLSVQIRYGFSNQMIAMTLCDTIIIDPLYAQEINDPEMLKVRTILDEHIVSRLPQHQKDAIEQNKKNLTPAAERFIFKHELGHVIDRCSLKRSLLMGAIISITTIIALLVVNALSSYSMALAGSVGFLVAMGLDFVLSYASRALFNVRQEIRADEFAVRFSSVEEINAAADFFEEAQKIYDASMDQLGILKYVPMSMVTGHYHGASRARMLRYHADQAALCKS